jgi:hypothetical protein
MQQNMGIHATTEGNMAVTIPVGKAQHQVLEMKGHGSGL